MTPVWLAVVCGFFAGVWFGYLATSFHAIRRYERATRRMVEEVANATPPYTFIPAQPVQPDFSRFN